MKQKLKIIVPTILITFVLTLGAVFLAAWLILGPDGISVTESLALVNLRFVGEYKINEVAGAAMDGMVKSLNDRWSYWLDAEGYKNQKENRSNSYVGIGVSVTYQKGKGLYIKSVAKGGPAEQAGLVAGETILKADGVSLAQLDLEKSYLLIKGEAGTSVDLEVSGADGTVRTVTVRRDVVASEPVSYKLLENGAGLVTLKNFYDRSADELKAAVEDLRGQGAKAIVFDLRNNPGGYLTELEKMLDYLLPKGPVFRSKTRFGNEDVVESDSSCVKMPIAVLVNGDSYSAAEFFAAELREQGWAIVGGDITCGKGYFQQTYPLLNGGSLSISTHTYFTGKGVSLIGTGVVPDPLVKLTDDQNALLIAGDLTPENDPQFQSVLTALGF
ncbi:putative CtpA-like serine protease [bioreactor metagenome]|uniref:Putative CtpA-like serine protease n=1 Tax=bioreactor metagenome TaxID=1076179 RepID=A0A644X1Z0_9ZZZZ